MDEEERKRAGVAKEYRDERIAVYWAPQFCIHSAVCLNAEPDVFDAQRRPWIVLEGVDADRIAEAVVGCPSGALTFERLDGGEQEEAVDVPVVTALADGPVLVLGDVTVRDASGEVTRKAARMTLWPRAQSRNKPFCDATHRLIGFRAS